MAPLRATSFSVPVLRELCSCAAYKCGVSRVGLDKGHCLSWSGTMPVLRPSGITQDFDYPVKAHKGSRGAGTRATIFPLRPTERPPGSVTSRIASAFASIYHVQVNKKPLTAIGHRSHCVLRLISHTTTKVEESQVSIGGWPARDFRYAQRSGYRGAGLESQLPTDR